MWTLVYYYHGKLLLKVVDRLYCTIVDLIHSWYKDILAYLVRSYPLRRPFNWYKFIFIIEVLQLSTNVQRMKQLNIVYITFNEWVYKFTLASMVCFHIVINKDMPTCFMNSKILLITKYVTCIWITNRNYQIWYFQKYQFQILKPFLKQGIWRHSPPEATGLL